MTEPCAECARLLGLIAMALTVLRRAPGGCVAKVREILEQAHGP